MSKRYKRRVRQPAHIRMIDKRYSGQMRISASRKALPRESSDEVGERAGKGMAAKGRRGFHPLPLQAASQPASPRGSLLAGLLRHLR